MSGDIWGNGNAPYANNFALPIANTATLYGGSMDIDVVNIGSGSHQIEFAIQDMTQGGIEVCDNNGNPITLSQTGITNIQCTNSFPITVNSGDTLRANFHAGDTTVQLTGANHYPYVVIYDSGGTNPATTTTGFISPYVPADLTTSTSTTVVFSVPYFFNDTTSFGIYDSVSLRITDLGDGTYVDTIPDTISASGPNTYSTSLVLKYSHQYLWQPRMYLASNPSQQIAGNISTLYAVAISTTTETLNPALLSGTVGTSTLPSAANFLSFLNVPQLLQTKVPFAYIFQVKDGLTQGIQSTSTTAIPAGNLSYKLPGQATTSIPFFSTSTVGYFLNQNEVSLLRGLMVAFLYVDFGYLLYRMAKSKKLL